MKKLFLLFTSSVLALGAQAQVANSSLVRMNTVEDRKFAKGLHTQAVQGVQRRNAATAVNGTANKGTITNHQRVYNYVDYLALSVNPDIGNSAGYLNAPYMWYNNDIYGVYQGTSALERDTITLSSIGSVLMPWFAGFNSVDWDPGTPVMTAADNYTVDSVVFYGAYGRNTTKPNIVDTVRIALTYGNGASTSNITTRYYTGMTANYGTDTVRSGFLNFNPATHTLGATSGSGVSVVTRDILLRSTDTGSNRRWAVATAMAVPAGNLVGASLTFRSGENYVPYSDTAFRGSVDPSQPFKYGMIRPYVYLQDLTGFPTYTRGNYNSGQFADLPESASEGLYFPNWAWTTANGGSPSDYQFPNVDFVITCPTCMGVGVKNVSPAVVGNVFPNPANNTVSLPITMKAAGTVNVTMSNLVSQVMASQSLGQVAASQKTTATFSTAGIANGVYFLTVEANGARTTSRFVVAH